MADITEVKVRVGDAEYLMPVNWLAASMITQQLGDPLQLMRQWERGDESWVTIQNAALIVAIGTRVSEGETLTQDEVGQALYENQQVHDALAAAGEYVAYLASGGKTAPSKKRGNSKGAGQGKGSRRSG